MVCRKAFIGLLLLAFGLWALPAWAGVVLTAADGSKTYISDGMLKQTSAEPQTVVFNADRETILMIDRDQKIYAEGTIKNFCQAGSSMVDAAMAELSPEERAMMKQMMSQARPPSGPRPKVSVAAAGSGGTVAGYPTRKYAVQVDGRPYEELWMSHDPAIMGELNNLEKLVKLTGQIGSCFSDNLGMEPSQMVETSPEYLTLYRQGYPLKTVSLEEGTPETVDEVVKVEKRTIPASEFRPPAGYRQVTFPEMMQAQSQ